MPKTDGGGRECGLVGMQSLRRGKEFAEVGGKVVRREREIAFDPGMAVVAHTVHLGARGRGAAELEK